MEKQEAIKIFEDKKVRTLWDMEQEKWYFSIVDVIKVLTVSPNARKYWSVLKTRLKKEGSQLTTNCSQLKMQSSDGKFYKTDVAELYQVDTKVLNQAVKRNIDRFPTKFRFQLTEIEAQELVTICDRFETLKHSSFLPYAFTEQRIAMLSAVLRSETVLLNLLKG